MLLPTTTLQRVADQVSCALDGEVAVLHLGSGRYFGMEQSALFLWDQLASSMAVSALTKSLVDNYDVDETQAGTDVHDFVTALLDAGLVERVTL